MSDTIIEAGVTTIELPDDLQGVARRYLDARRGANEKTMEAAAALYEAKQLAVHGEWYTFLKATNTGEDLADRLLSIYAEAQRNPAFRDTVIKGWLPTTQAALVARPSTPPEARAQVVAQATSAGAANQPPPTKREVQTTIQTMKGTGAESKSRTGAGFAAAPARPIELTSMASTAPTGAPTLLASVPAGQPATLPPMLNLGGAATLPPVLVIGAPAPPAAAHIDPVWIAEITVAILGQALTVAEVERDRVRHQHGGTDPISLSDAMIEQAARDLLAHAAMQQVIAQAARQP